MLKARVQAAQLVAREFLQAEHAADHAAMLAASCVTTMLVQRDSANLPVGTGLEAIRLVTEAAADLVRARQRLVEAHGALVDVRTQIGLGTMYGDEFECPKIAGLDRTARAVTLASVA